MKRFSLPFALLVAAILPGCAELTQLRERTAIQEAEIKKLREDNAEFQKAYYQINEERKSDAGAQQDKIASLEKALDEARRVKSDRERKLEEDLRKKSAEADDLKSQLEARVSKATETLAQMTDTASKAESQKTQLQSQLDQANAQLAKDQELVKQLQGQLEEQKKLAAELQSKLKNAEEARKSAESGAGETKETVEKLNAQIKELKSKPQTVSPEDDSTLKKAAQDLTERLGRFEAAKGVSVKLDKKGLRVIIPSDIIFEKGTVTLSENIKPVLADLAEAAGELSGRPVRI
ncbi:hypothetical protein HY256_01935, partial [Candidatus Sumerlaeota bacterium]|nr:hypothetical protein [Candidatus Sumerlaeota bacterium]